MSGSQNTFQHQKTSDRAYFLIPSGGSGTAGTNYGETDYGYDALERLNRTVAPGGTPLGRCHSVENASILLGLRY